MLEILVKGGMMDRAQPRRRPEGADSRTGGRKWEGKDAQVALAGHPQRYLL